MGERLAREEKKRERAREATEAIPAPDYTDELLEGYEIDRMLESIRGLPEKYREVLELSARGRGEAEIAEALAIRPGTVKSRLSRGRELLARSMRGGETQ